MTAPMTRLLSSTLVLGFAACAAAPDDVCIAERRLAANRLAANAIATNRLAANELLTEALPEIALTSASIAEAIDPVALEDEFVQSVLEYMVSCALAPGQTVEIAVAGDVVVYEGSLGLAPQWGAENGECDGACEGWVSACLIARTNFKGESVPISLLGEHASLVATEDEASAYDVEEATYFGDLFGETKAMYACVPAGASGPVRTCGTNTAGCAITVLGECDTVCDESGCRDPNGLVHAQTITVNTRDAAADCE